MRQMSEGKFFVDKLNKNTIMLSQRFSNRKIIVDILAVMFGLSTWIGVNSIYNQLPLLVNNAPEGWDLPAYMVMLVQFANLGPILYSLYTKYTGWAHDKLIIYILLAVATVAMLILSQVYEKKSTIFGKEFSTAVLSMMLVTSVVGCTSSVLFMPYMRNYREIYIISFLVGEGLSGFIPSILALIQGVGENSICINITDPKTGKLHAVASHLEPRFQSNILFILIGTLLLMSFLSFIGLNSFKVALGERVKLPSSMEALPTDTKAPPNYKTNSGWKMSNKMFGYLLTIIAVICFLGHGTLPSIQSYSCLPYGNVVYHLTVTLASIASPLAMCLGFFIKESPSNHLLSILVGLVLVISSFIYYLAVNSPNPPLQNTWIGKSLVVIVWVLVSGLIGFIKMGITTIFRPDPGRGLYYIGVTTQIGSVIGAMTTFLLLKYTNIFQSYNPCFVADL